MKIVEYGKSGLFMFMLSLGTRDDCDDEIDGNKIVIYFLWLYVYIDISMNILKPYKFKANTNGYREVKSDMVSPTIQDRTLPKLYEISLALGDYPAFSCQWGINNDGMWSDIQGFGGSYYTELPWAALRFVNQSVYKPDHTFYMDVTHKDDWYDNAIDEIKEVFLIRDYDGVEIEVTTYITSRTWEKGQGWFKWISKLGVPLTRRSLSLDFNKEFGVGKHGWKGGTTGHSTAIHTYESTEFAMRKYAMENNATYIKQIK